jgi:hypothetical protein
MNYDAREPCKTCPYRKDVPPKTWHRSEFENLLAQDRNEFGGAVFQCHQDRPKPAEERGFCIGWLLDQRARGLRSIQLRLHLIKGGEAAGKQIQEAHAPAGVKLYPSIAAMCRANGVRA